MQHCEVRVVYFSDVCGENAYCVPRGASLIACVCLDGENSIKVMIHWILLCVFLFQDIRGLGLTDATKTDKHFWRIWWLTDWVWYSWMFQLINQSRIPESRGLLSRRGRESRRRQSRQKTVSASTCLRRGVHKCKLAFSVVPRCLYTESSTIVIEGERDSTF